MAYFLIVENMDTAQREQFNDELAMLNPKLARRRRRALAKQLGGG